MSYPFEEYEIDQMVKEWHDAKGFDGLELREYLMMTPEQYAYWMKNAEAPK